MGYVVEFVLLLLAVPFPEISTVQTTAKEPAEAQPAEDRQTLVTVSRETTRITEPLDEQGFVDYVGYLNRRDSEGVTPDNNAVVLYWQAIGPVEDETAPEFRRALVEKLGVDVFAGDGPYLIGIGRFAQQQVAIAEEQTGGKSRLTVDAIFEMQGRSSEGPWTAADMPPIAEWLRLNERPLDLAVAATKRSHYYSPLIAPEDASTLFATLLTNVQQYRSIARLLSARAMLNLGNGDAGESQRDLLAMHRLARHCGRGNTLIEWLVGVAIDAMAVQGDRQLALHGGLTAEQLTQYRRELARLGPVGSFRRVVDEGERFCGLDSVQFLLRSQSGDTDAAFELLGIEIGGGVARQLLGAAIDWNLVLTMLNQHYDRTVDACGRPTHRERVLALNRIERELQDSAGKEVAGGSVLRNLFLGQEGRSKQMGTVLMANLAPALGAAYEAGQRSQAKLDVLQTGLAILAYRADRGELPAKLSELTPDYLDAVPTDCYTDDALIYRTQGDEFIVYCIGQNLKDDGGKSFDSGFDDLPFASAGWQFAP